MTMLTTPTAVVRHTAALTRQLICGGARTAAKIARMVGRGADRLAHHAHRLVSSTWNRHHALMDEQPNYRAKLLAVVSAIVALTGLPPKIAAVLHALVRLYTAAYDSHPDEWSEWR